MHPVTPIRVSQILVDGNTYVKRTATQLWGEMPLLLAGALVVDLSAAFPILLFRITGNVPLACAVGLFTCLPAWTGYCYTVGRNTAQFKPRLGDLLSAFFHYYGRSCVLGIPLVILLPAALITLPWLAGSPPLLVVTGITIQVLALLFSCLLLVHAFPLLACFDLSLRQVWANSLILVMRWPLVAVSLLSMAFLLTLAARTFGLGTWLILPLLFAPFEVNAALMLTKQVVGAQGQDC